MKKIILIVSLTLIGNYSIAQNPALENKVKETEEIEINVKRSAFSIGFSPFIYLGINDYRNTYGEDIPGLGIEIMGLYRLNKKINIGGFAKLKGELGNGGELPIPGDGYGEGEKIVTNGAGSVGVIIEYKIFNRIGLNLRVGYEDILTKEEERTYEYDSSTGTGTSTIVEIDNDPGFIYGGGISFYTKRKEPHTALHSFNLGIVFEKNNYTTVDGLDISNNTYERSRINAFYIHFGWRIMFHNLKSK